MNVNAAFSVRTVATLAGLVAILFGASLLLSGRGGESGATAGANSYSRSAIGYLALYEFLKASGFDVVRARGDVATKLGTNGVLVLAEPGQSLSGDDSLLKRRTARATLLILPKWAASPDRAHQGWIAEAEMYPPAFAQAVLFGFDAKPEVVGVLAPSRFDGEPNGAPTLSGTVQLARGAKLKPLLSTKDGVLLGEIDDAQRRAVVLADPDALDNHGLGEGDNAAFARRLFDQLGGVGVRFVFDETIHGFSGDEPTHDGGGAHAPDLTASLLRFPANLTLALALVALALLGGATVGRFGAPQTPPRALRQDKRGLITNIASLIDYGGHHGEMLEAYVEAVVRDAGQALKAPANLRLSDLGVWLDRLGQARGVQASCAGILAAAATAGKRDLPRLLEAAQAIHRWREEIVRGAP